MNSENSEDQDRELEQMYADTLHRIHSGMVVKGRVMSIKPAGVLVDIGYKSEGTVAASEFSNDEISRLNAGDEIYVFIERINDHEGVITLSRERAAKINAWETLSAPWRAGGPLKARWWTKPRAA